MSGWGLAWFGGGSSARRSEGPKKAILGLRSQLEMLSKRQSYLESQIVEQEALARKHVSGNKAAAKAALRRKKQFETNLDQTNSHMLTLEEQIQSIESANINKETLEAMKNASKAMKEIHAGTTIDKVDQTMDDIREQHIIGKEISDAIAQSIGTETLDETELEEEFEQLQQEELDAQMTHAGPAPADKINQLPTAPETIKGKTPVAQTAEDDEEEELRKLQAEMAM